MNVVVDVNVLVSLAMGSRTLAPIQAAWEQGRIALLVSEPLLSELGEVLSREKLARYFPEGGQRSYLEAVRAVGVPVTPETPYPDFVDPDDAYLLAMLKRAELLVTGDRALLELGRFGEALILSPRAFMEVLTNPR